MCPKLKKRLWISKSRGTPLRWSLFVVEIVSKYKYLGTTFDDELNWADNTEAVVEKGQHWVY